MTVASRISRRSLLATGAASLAIPTLITALTGKAGAQEGAAMRLRFTFADQVFTATLENTAPARDLFSVLPLDLKISDYADNEKIAYLPRKLSGDGSSRISNGGGRRPLLLRALGQPRDVLRPLSMVARLDPPRSSGWRHRAPHGARRIPPAR